LNDLSNQSALHTIRLYHDIGSLHTNSTNVADWQALFERSDETSKDALLSNAAFDEMAGPLDLA
jgi:hypothetical protein